MTLWRCDHCGGRAAWTLDRHGDPWYICEKNCKGFAQGDLFGQEVPEFEMEPSRDSGVEGFSERDDSDVEALPF